MTSLIAAFITGITTGGLSCMAVQGGLLAGSLASQIENDLLGKRLSQKGELGSNIAYPIVLFLSSKLLVYTLFGGLLGGLGKVLQLTPVSQAVLQFVIAFFVIGNALRMLNVHPIFRYFSFEPPAFITRFIRKKARKESTRTTPIILGAMTVLIPCGVTQTMMAAAIASGDVLLGAALMFAFTLGTSPIFFLLSYFATKLGSLTEKYFTRITAVVLVIFGLLAVDTGLNLLGSRYSLTRLASDVGSSLYMEAESQTGSRSDTELVLNVIDKGYRPRRLHAPAGVPVTLTLIAEDVYSCSRAFLIPEIDYGVILFVTDEVKVDIPPQEHGTVMPFTCSMGMYTGEIIFDL